MGPNLRVRIDPPPLGPRTREGIGNIFSFHARGKSKPPSEDALLYSIEWPAAWQAPTLFLEHGDQVLEARTVRFRGEPPDLHCDPARARTRFATLNVRVVEGFTGRATPGAEALLETDHRLSPPDREDVGRWKSSYGNEVVFDWLEPGTFTLFARAPDFVDGRAEVELERDRTVPLVLPLAPAWSIGVRLEAEERDALPAIDSAEVRDATDRPIAHPDSRRVQGDHHRLRPANLPAGRHFLVARGNAFRFRGAEGENDEVESRLREPPAARSRLEFASTDAVRDTKVRASTEGGITVAEARRGSLSSAGTAEATLGITPGEYAIVVEAGASVKRFAVRVGWEERQPFSLRIR